MKNHTNANQIKMAYQMDGPENGPVVMMSNSLMSSLEMWDSNIHALTDRYRVIRYDTRGHGQTQVTEGPYSIALLAHDLVSALSLSLCDTASEMPPRSLWEERFAIARTQGIAGLVDGTIKRWFLSEFIQREPQQIEHVKHMILGTPVDGYLACASAVRDMAQSTMLLKIKVPTMVLVGKQDPACTVDQATVLHRLIPHSSMVVLDQAAHLANIEQPLAFNKALRGFLDSVA